MMHSLRFVPEIETDVLTGRMWYEDKAPGLGEEFLRVFYFGLFRCARDPRRVRKELGSRE